MGGKAFDDVQLPGGTDSRYPKTAADALAKWDAGEIVTTIERGGMGPGYEQCIHVLVFEIIRDYIGKDLPETGAKWSEFGQETLARLKHLRLSGAQVQVGRDLAYRYLKDGYRATIDDYKVKFPKDDLICVSTHWPRAQP